VLFVVNKNRKENVMRLEEIEVFIDKDGQVQIKVQGVKGRSCLELTAGLEKALGGQVTRDMTSEFYEVVEETVDDPLRVKG
jgi:hypothetical protein